MLTAAHLRSTLVGAAGMSRVAARQLPIDISAEADFVADRLIGASAQTQTIISGIVIGAALLVGFFVVDSIDDAAALGDRPNDSLDEDKNSTLDRIGDGMLIGGVIIIVLFAAIILRVLRGL